MLFRSLGVEFGSRNAPSGVEVTYEFLLEIGIGDAGSEVSKIQVPYSYRADTGVGYWLLKPINFFLAEPFSVSSGSRIAVRLTNSQGSDTVSGVKIMYMEVAPPVSPLNGGSFLLAFV